MLLRSTSAPILSSWLPQHCSRESPPEPESRLKRRNRSLYLLSSKSTDGEHTLPDHKESTVLKSRNSDNDNKNVISRRQRRSSLDESVLIKSRSSDNDNKNVIPRRQRRSSLDESSRGTAYRRKVLDPSPTFLLERLFSSSGLGEKKSDDDDRLETLVSGGGVGMGSSGGGGGHHGGSDVDGGGSEEATDAYYREMIESNSGNSLLTGNYAKFLKEVRGDMKKAEEYCERAILGNTNDGNVLSLYADLILQNHGDRKRAHSYFQQATKMSPEDCYVQASYAKFLWEVDEDEDEGEEEEQRNGEIGDMPPTTTFRDFPQHTPITSPS
ncbi:unnamed protein product [Microthlaspi erraticum]|uniref:Uncharacterized protein n=1 Tax=Microthlaspi erraticum TaxID=1685480 RepID=A0A6D2IFT4_9BRAS|nr:unnamed protein product [Microthlaspi erraticum]